MADLLGLIRDFTIHNKEIKEDGEEIIFNNHAWRKDTKTNYVIWGTDKHGCTKEHYPLESITYFLKNTSLSHAQFVRQSAACNIPCIRLPDRQKLLDYLNGKIATCDSIDLSVPIDISQRRLISNKEIEPEVEEPPIKYQRIEDESEQQRLAAKLAQPAGGRATALPDITLTDASQTSTLPEKISVDKIQMLRAKFRAKLQQTIKPDDENGLMVQVHSKTIAAEIAAREYTWRTRTSVLQAQKKTFFESVVNGVLRSAKAREEGLGSRLEPRAAVVVPEKTVPTHYSRYDQERFSGAGQDTAGFKIDTMGSYHGMGLSSMMTNGAQASRDPRASRQPERSTATPTSTARPQSPGPIRSGKSKSRVPIIVIPAAGTSLITMLNARDILEDLRYLSAEEKRAAGYRRDNELLIQRPKADGRTVPYRVIDQPGKLTADEWDRVVAVFVQGPAWQFKGWPIGGGDPARICALVRAFHLKQASAPVHTDVAKWNVHVIPLDSRRHLDKANFQQVWDLLDRHMLKAKPHLRF